MKNYRIAVIPGDNIGPELMKAALAVLEATQKVDGGFTLEFETCLAGAAHYTEHGTAMSDEAIAACRAAASVFKAPVGDPAVRTPEGIEAGLLGGVLRTGLDLYANVRPVKLYPGTPTPLHGYQPGGIDYVIIRENTEGLYASRGKGVGGPNAMADTMIVTRAGTERVVRFAFEAAKKRNGAPADGVRRVTCVEKSNVLRSFALFREIFLEIAGEYPGSVQAIHPGSYVVIEPFPALHSFTVEAWVWPTRPDAGVQGILCRWSPESGSGFGLFIGDDGAPELWLGSPGEPATRTSSGHA
ncbi:MAG: isocitrate/isopropylmalate family dehydrogenase, partial [Nitrospinota bacterium]|nr:isocitrate/isopropylmalate family dehydrogenase [Nitrospinota bacterium]